MSNSKSPILCLVKIQSPFGDEARLFEKSPFIIGREQKADLVVAHSSISRKHLIVQFDQTGVRVTDAGTVNGSYCQEQKINPHHELLIKSNDQIKLGLSEDFMQFQIIPRPLEIHDLQTQQEKIKDSLHEVVFGLKNYVREQAQEEVEREIALYKINSFKDVDALKEKTLAELKELKESTQAEVKHLKDTTLAEVVDLKSKALKEAAELKETSERTARELLRASELEATEKKARLMAHIDSEILDYKEKERTRIEIFLSELKSTELKALEDKKQQEQELLQKEKELIEKQKHELESFLEKHKAAELKNIEEIREQALLKLEEHTEEEFERIEEHKLATQKLLDEEKLANQKFLDEEKFKIEKEKADLETYLAERKESELKNIYEENRQLEKKKTDLELELKTIQEQFQNFTLEAKLTAERKIQDWLRESQTRLQEDEKKAFEKQALLQRETQEKIKAEIRRGEQKSEEIISLARNEAEKLRDLAQSDSQSIRKTALEQAEKTNQQAKLDADQLVRQMTEEFQARFEQERKTQTEKIAAECQKMLAEAEERTHVQQKAILYNYQDQIRNIEKLAKETESAFKQNQQLHIEKTAELERVQLELAGIGPQLESKKIEFGEVLAKVNDAEAIIRKAREEKKNLEVYAEQRVQFEEENRKKKEELTLDFDERKRYLEKELSQLTLQHQESLKKQIQAEELRIKEVRRNQASEIARMIEVRLTEQAKTYIADSAALAKFSQDLFTVTRHVLSTEESTFQPLTNHLEEHQPNIVEKNQRYLKPFAFTATACFLAFAFYFRLDIIEYYKGKDENSLAKQMIEQRRIQSIYVPDVKLTYQNSYVENVLHFKHYEKLRADAKFQEAWTLRLNDIAFLRRLKITDYQMVEFQAGEALLVAKLSEMKKTIDSMYLDKALEGMRKVEFEEVGRLKAILQGQSNENNRGHNNFEKIREVEKQFIESYLNSHRDQYPL